eukprot:g6217.t1
MAAVAEDSGSALNTDAATEEVDDTAFLNPASKKAENDDDFVMGVAKQGGQSENDSEMKGGDATSERIMFELLVRVGSDPNISCEDLVSEQFAVLSDAIVADVEDGIGDFIAKHFVDCVRDFPSKTGIYSSLEMKTLFEELKEYSKVLISETVKEKTPQNADSVWHCENPKEGMIVKGMPMFLSEVIESTEAQIASNWENNVVSLSTAEILYKHVRSEIADAEAPGEDDEEDEGPISVEAVDIASFTPKNIVLVEEGSPSVLDTYVECSSRHSLFIDCKLEDTTRGSHRETAMKALSCVDKVLIKQLVGSILRGYYPMSGEAVDRISNLDMNAEHLILETVFNDMLQLPHSPYPWVYYANVIAGLCKAKKGTYPPALAEIVDFLFVSMGSGLPRGTIVSERDADRIHSKVYLKDAAADRLSEWMAWQLNRFKWNWPFEWWKSDASGEQQRDGDQDESLKTPNELTRGQEAFIAALCRRCTSISYADKIRQEFTTWMHPFIDACSGVAANPYLVSSENKVYRRFFEALVTDLKAGKNAGTINTTNVLQVMEQEAKQSQDSTTQADLNKNGKAPISTIKINKMPEDDLRSCIFAIFQSGHKTLTHLRSRIARFKQVLLDLIVEDDGERANGQCLVLVQVVSEFWPSNPTYVMHALSILIEFRIIEASDVIEYYLLKDVTSPRLWYSRFWPWEIMNSVCIRTFRKECIAEPRPYAGIQLDQREKRAEERYLNEKQLRQRNATKIENIFKEFRETCTEAELLVLEQRYQFLKEEFGEKE